MYVSDNGDGSTIAARYADDYEEDDEEEEEIYIVQQEYGYCSISLSVAQTVIYGIGDGAMCRRPIQLEPHDRSVSRCVVRMGW
jgi:hypothetical protein